MTELADVLPFPNSGVKLIEEDDLVSVWEEVFEPGIATPPHRHTCDYVAMFPEGGELTITLLAGIGDGREVHEMDPERIEAAIGWLRARNPGS